MAVQIEGRKGYWKDVFCHTCNKGLANAATGLEYVKMVAREHDDGEHLGRGEVIIYLYDVNGYDEVEAAKRTHTSLAQSTIFL